MLTPPFLVCGATYAEPSAAIEKLYTDNAGCRALDQSELVG